MLKPLLNLNVVNDFYPSLESIQINGNLGNYTYSDRSRRVYKNSLIFVYKNQ